MEIKFKISLLFYSCIKCPNNNPLFPGEDEFLQDLGKCFHEDKDFVLFTVFCFCLVLSHFKGNFVDLDVAASRVMFLVILQNF